MVKRGCIPGSPGESGLVSREAKDSALLSSRIGYFLDPTEWPKGSQSSCKVWREDQGLLSRSGCWRRLLRVPWTARRSNQSILKEINPEYSLEGLISAGKESAYNTRDSGSIRGLGRSSGEVIGYPLKYSDLENSMVSSRYSQPRD